MKLSTTQVTKLLITELEHMDPIALIVEDFGPGAGKITITSSGEAWCHSWSHMGEHHTLRSFFGRCSTPYLVGKLKGRIEANIPDEDSEVLAAILHKRIIERRREGDLERDKARELWDNSMWVCFGDHRDLCEEVFGGEWWEDMPKKSNPEYDWLVKIVDTVKEAFAQEKAEATAAQAQAGAVPQYRLLQSGVDRIEAADEFLSDDTLTWAADPKGIFVGNIYGGHALRPARRHIKGGQHG